MGARMARDGMLGLYQSVTVHAVAAWISAQTEYGAGPTHASKIAHALPAATAKLNVLDGMPAGYRARRWS